MWGKGGRRHECETNELAGIFSFLGNRRFAECGANTVRGSLGTARSLIATGCPGHGSSQSAAANVSVASGSGGYDLDDVPQPIASTKEGRPGMDVGKSSWVERTMQEDVRWNVWGN